MKHLHNMQGFCGHVGVNKLQMVEDRCGAVKFLIFFPSALLRIYFMEKGCIRSAKVEFCRDDAKNSGGIVSDRHAQLF